MLVQKPSSPLGQNDVVVFKTLAGEEVIGRLALLDDTSITISRPVSLRLHQMQNGQGAVGFEPFMFGLEDDAKVAFRLANLATQPVKARSDLSGSYMKATTTLDVPQGPGLVI